MLHLIVLLTFSACFGGGGEEKGGAINLGLLMDMLQMNISVHVRAAGRLERAFPSSAQSGPAIKEMDSFHKLFLILSLLYTRGQTGWVQPDGGFYT